MKQKLTSRKFWLSIVSATLVVLNDGLDLGIDQETVLVFAGLIFSFIFSEGIVDATRAKKGVVSNEPDYAAGDQTGE